MGNAIAGAIVVANHGMPFLRLDIGERSGQADQRIKTKDDFLKICQVSRVGWKFGCP